MKKFNLILCFFLYAFSITCFAQTIQQLNKTLPVLDKTKSYPSKKLNIETQITYVPLETAKDVLLGGACRLRYVSNERFVLSDEILGDVFIFDNSGKIHSSFNRKGGLGYIFITFIAYDEKSSELYILDGVRKKIFVYSENGTLLRSFGTPQNTYFAEIYNFDNSTLLAFDENRNGSDKPIKPYLYIAKNDGKVTGNVNINLTKVNPSQFTENTGKNQSRSYVFSHSGIPDNCKFGNDFILANKSMDTIYLLKQDKTLIPLFSQTPSVYSEHPTAASVGMINNQFLTICVSSYDIKEGVKVMKAGGKWKPKFRFFNLDTESGEFFENTNKEGLAVYKTDIPKNQSVELMQPFRLLNAYKNGLLKGDLKEVASKLDIGDNPVIKITRLK